jgi:putative transposase
MFSVSERQACGLVRIAVSSYRYQALSPERDEALRLRLTALAQEHPRYGSPRLCFLLRREELCNHKRVERIIHIKPARSRIEFTAEEAEAFAAATQAGRGCRRGQRGVGDGLRYRFVG